VIKVAVIDDEYIVLEGMKAVLRRCQVEHELIGTAANSMDAMTLLRNHTCDVAFIDICLSGCSGLDMMEQLRNEGITTDFVVISGYTEFDYAQRAIRLGVFDYIDKPITIEKVRRVMESLEKRLENSRKIPNLFNEIIDSIQNRRVDEFKEKTQEFLYKSEIYDMSQEKIRSVYEWLCMIEKVIGETFNNVNVKAILPSWSEIESIREYDILICTIQNSLNQMCLLFPNRERQQHRTISQIEAYLKEHLSEEISLCDVSEEFHLSPGYISVLFKKETGSTLVKQLNNLRVERAKILLSQGEKVGITARQVGFSNYRYFIDIFKRQVGLTPNEYRGHIISQKNE